jgi:hypothetical protein
MTWDLAKALHKKAEFETARLQAFGFQQRARAIGLMAQAHGLDDKTLAAELAVTTDQQLIEQLCRLTGLEQAQVTAAFNAALAEAWRQLVAEQGDPTPHRLA